MPDDPGRRSRASAAAGLLVGDGTGRIMLVQPTYKEHWDIPGGYVECGETPAEACAREVREELGLDLPVGRLLVVDWAPLRDEGDKVLFVFDGGTLDDACLAYITLQTEELASYAYVEPAEAAALVGPRLARRLAAAVEARSSGRPSYLEHGVAHPSGRPS